MIEDRALTFRDFADSLKLEVSDIPPSKERYIKEFVVKVKGVVERKYGRYFGGSTLNIVRGLEERIVSFSPGTFREYIKMMVPERKGPSGIKGAHFSEKVGDTIAIESRKYLMRIKDSKESVAILTAAAIPSRKEAIKVFKSMVFMGTTIHEIIHAYEYPGLPDYFSECAAPYYAMQIQNELQQIGIIEKDGKKRADFYEGLIKGFGEDVHGLFFGLNRKKEFKDKVFVAFTPEILKELFPDGYGTTKKELKNSGC